MNRKLGTYICCSIIFAFGINLVIISPLLTEISQSFHVGLAESGILFAANASGLIFFALAGGILSDRYGKKRIMLVSLAGFSASLFAFPLSPNYTSACILMFILGGFGGALEALSNALVSDLNPENNSFYVNLLQVFFGMGALVGPVAAGVAVSSGLSWKACYYFLGIIYLMLTIVFMSVRLPDLPQTGRVKLSDIRGITSDRRFLLACLCMILYTGSEVGSWGWMSTFVKETLGFSITRSGITVAVFWAAMTIGRMACGSLVLKYSARRLIIILSALSAVVTAFSGFVRSEAALWVVITTMGLTYSSQWPFILSYGSGQSKAPSGIVFSILLACGSTGNTIIPYLMGLLADSTSMRIAMVSPAALLLAVCLIFIIIERIPDAKHSTGLNRRADIL